MPLYEDLVKNYKVHYLAGGAAQNSIRGAQVPVPERTFLELINFMFL